MTTTTYYNLNIAEGTDIVNPLTVDNPNYQKIDEAMHDNAVAGVTLAAELTNSTIHALTRENSDCSVIRFIATSRWKAGDSMTVDGVPVLALLPSGETLPDGAYVINTNVLCVLTGTNLTVYVNSKNALNASEIPYKDTNVEAELDKLNTSLQETNTSLQQTNASLQEIESNLNSKPTYYVGVEEHIATMENGTKVYRKRFSNYEANVSSTLILDASLNLETITPINMVGSCSTGGGVEWRAFPLFFTSNDFIYIDCQSSGLSIYIQGNVIISGYNVEITYIKK